MCSGGNLMDCEEISKDLDVLLVIEVFLVIEEFHVNRVSVFQLFTF